MMRRIDLDYGSKRRSPLGWVLLGAGLTAACAALLLYASLADQSEQWEQVVRKAARRHAGPGAPRADPEDRRRLLLQVEDANQVIGRLSLPWNELFRSIEDAAMERVALLSFQPQPQQRLITLHGEARSYADVLEYMERLDSSRTLSRARLLSHRVKSEDPRHPVDFTIAANWRISQ